VPETLTDPRWFLVAGAVLIAMALLGARLRRLPLSTSMVYLTAGVALGPLGLGLIVLDPIGNAGLIEVVAEVAVIVSLFTAGLKLRLPLRDRLWLLPIRLAVVSMVVTVALVTLVGVALLGLPLGAAVLLGAILAPTDPVLASEVQIADPRDRDRFRFAVTGEAGLNDGTAFPFVMLGLGLLGLHELGPLGIGWLGIDVVWAVAVGIGCGGALGVLVGRLVLYLRARHQEATGLDEFLALGLISLSYGAAVMAHAYGFLAVFAAGVCLRHIERSRTGDDPPPEIEAEAASGAADEVATKMETAPAYLARAVLGFNEQLERIGEVVVVIVLGAMLSVVGVHPALAWFVPLLLLVIRPVAVVIGLLWAGLSWLRIALIGWFGIRGVGSVYYLAFAITHGLEPGIARDLAALTLGVAAVSIVVHGVSVTPLMGRYERRRRDTERPAPPGEAAATDPA
jgi:NhaP-type Na+/H+ or K+/H+ antiporter